ncbi:MAG: S-methyl-5'-thioinosine phosphorylase [Gammaproteobacteria bacterium]|nr:S-methyl-5'-thioinosine phosphorylase [Gammaproteobacteria bacterium]MBT8065043.1 S-methyl-5'-thioinosine phosphorylase [Gammaproteobacteria bacterium]
MNGKKVLGLIGGTGLTQLGEPAGELDLETPFGKPSAPLREMAGGPVRLLFLPRHGDPHRYPPHCVNYRANLWALKEAGAQQVLAVSAVGGLHQPYAPGVLAVPDQLVDYTWGRAHTFSDSADVSLVHVDFTRPYEGPLREALLAAATAAGVEVVDGGCIGVFQGPRLESAAEIERARRNGCDLAGMTSLPEAGLARELGLDFAGLAVVSNWAAGVGGRTVSEDDIAETLKEPMSRVRQLLNVLMENL